MLIVGIPGAHSTDGTFRAWSGLGLIGSPVLICERLGAPILGDGLHFYSLNKFCNDTATAEMCPGVVTCNMAFGTIDF